MPDDGKAAAGRLAAETYVRDGMRLGLGSGSTAHAFVRALGERVRAGLAVTGVPTSRDTRALALELGIPLADLDDLGELDLAIDGADEIDPDGAMIKGGGACLLWEKIVANASARMVAVADASKLVDVLGAFPLPIEVVPFGWTTTRRSLAGLLERLGYRDVAIDLRVVAGEALVTDSGHYIVDAALRRITDKDALLATLNQVPGVVEHGLFVGVADEIVIGHPDGRAEVVRAPGLRQ